VDGELVKALLIAMTTMPRMESPLHMAPLVPGRVASAGDRCNALCAPATRIGARILQVAFIAGASLPSSLDGPTPLPGRYRL